MARRTNQRVTVPEPADSVEALLTSRDIVIACGSGGVGKTTTAAAMAAMAATHLGGKVLVLTVDPAGGDEEVADALAAFALQGQVALELGHGELAGQQGHGSRGDRHQGDHRQQQAQAQ